MYYFVEILCVISELWMLCFLYSGMYPKRDSALKYPLLVTIGIGLTVLSFGVDLAFVRIFVNFLAFWAVGLVLYRGGILRSAFTSLIMCALAAVADILTSVVMDSFHMELQILLVPGTPRMIYLIADHILLFGLVFCIYALGPKSSRQISFRVLIPLLPCWSTSCLLCVLLAWEVVMSGKELSPLYPVVLIGMLYTNIVVIYYTNRITKSEQEKRERALAEHHYAMQREYYDQFRIQQEETRALWHDIRKLIQGAKLDDGDTLTQLEEILDGVETVVDVDNRVLNVILNEYAQACKNADIHLDLEVLVPQELFVPAVDLYVLLGNTIDNAMDACSELPSDERRISLKLKTHNKMLFYEIENPFLSSHMSRVRGKMHGYGLQNVKQCVERYNGTLETQQKDGHFRLTAHLNE